MVGNLLADLFLIAQPGKVLLPTLASAQPVHLLRVDPQALCQPGARHHADVVPISVLVHTVSDKASKARFNQLLQDWPFFQHEQILLGVKFPHQTY